MKYLVSWTVREGGPAADNEKSARRSLDVFSKWSPSEGSTYHQFLNRLDGEGGFAVVEADDPGLVLRDTSKFEPWFKFQVVPVLDIQEAVPLLNEAIEFRGSIG